MKKRYPPWFNPSIKSMTTKALFSITMILLFPLIFSAIYLANDHIKDSTLECQQDLSMIASELDSVIYPLMSQLVTSKHSVELTPYQQVIEINEILQPQLDKVAQANPGVELGYYDIELNSIVAIAPYFSQGKLRPLDHDEPYFALYSTGEHYFTQYDSSIWDGESTLTINHPIFVGDKIVGHTWANMKMKDIYLSAWVMALKTFLGGLALWLIVLFFIRRIIRQMQKSLQSFSSSIVDDQIDHSQLDDFPELEPVMSKIKAYAQELKATNEALYGLNSLLTNIIEGITEVFFSLNLQGQFTYINKAAEHFTGMQRSAILGKNIWEVLPHPVGSPPFLQMQKAMNSEQGLHWETPWDNKWFEFHTYPFKDGLSIFVRDITLRKILEEDAFELASIVENANIAIIGRTVDGIITSWNIGAKKLFGYEPEEVLGKHLFTIIAPNARPITMEVIQASKKGESIPAFENVGIKKDGTEIDLSVVLSLVRNQSGEVSRVSAIMSDITTIKRSQREIARLDRLNLIGQMAAGISHEVRNPLTTVRGFLQMLGAKKELILYQDHFSLMISELDRANSIITEFLSLSRNKPPHLAAGNINHLLTKLFPIVQADAFNSGKDVSIELDEVSDIWMDENEVRQLVLNLLRNAIEETPVGTKVILRTRQVENTHIVLEVEDQGRGIPPEVLEKLGTPFNTTKDNGTGIGLSICYGIAERHNATIDVKTGATGTVFYVTFPTLESTENQP